MEARNELLEKYVRMQAQLIGELSRIEQEAVSVRDRLALIDDMLTDMKALGAIPRAAAPVAQAQRPVAAAVPVRQTAAPVIAVGLPMTSVQPEDASQHVQAAPAAAPVGRGRGKGRPGRPPGTRASASVTSAAPINELSIVDAAIELAKQHGAREAKASDVQDWFELAGYAGRNGTPNRNSIYVSLNREANQTVDDPNARLKKERRGVFTFAG